MTDKPNSLLVHCGPCRHEWFALKLPMPMYEAAEMIAKMNCPKCNASSDRIYYGPVINTSAERVKKREKVNMRYSCRAVVGHGQVCEPNYQCEACAAKQKYIPRIEKLEETLRFYACDCKPDDGCGIEYYDGGAYCGYTARKALEGKDE